MRKMLFLLAAIPSVVEAQTPDINSLHLVCLGAGSTSRATTSSAYIRNSDGGGAWGNVVSRRDVPFEDQVNVEIVNGEGRIRVPRTMLPTFTGGKDGWFQLKNLKITDRDITASAAINFMNAPKVRLDRITGGISISGRVGEYSGECQPYDPATAQRKF